MGDLPYGARHLFEKTYRLPGCEYVLEHDAKHLEVIKIYEDKKNKLIKPFQEIDSLLSSDKEWQFFCLDLIDAGVRFSRASANRERDKRREVEVIRKKIGNVANNLFNLLVQYSDIAGQEADSYGYYYDVRLDNLELLLSRAADFHNNNYNKFKLVPCEYDEEFSSSIRELINSRNKVCMPSSWAVVGAIADECSTNADLKDRREGGDILDFVPQTSKADFIRGITNTLKKGVKYGRYSVNIMNLSFVGLGAIAEVFYPLGGARADQVIDKDWNPKKDSKKGK